MLDRLRTALIAVLVGAHALFGGACWTGSVCFGHSASCAAGERGHAAGAHAGCAHGAHRCGDDHDGYADQEDASRRFLPAPADHAPHGDEAEGCVDVHIGLGDLASPPVQTGEDDRVPAPGPCALPPRDDALFPAAPAVGVALGAPRARDPGGGARLRRHLSVQLLL